MEDASAFERTTQELKQAFNGHGLVFTPVAEANVEKFENFMQAGHWAWVAHTGGEGVQSYSPTHEIARMDTEARASGKQFDFMVQREPNGPYLAHVNVSVSPEERVAMFGYYVIPPARKQGVASETASIVKEQLAGISDTLGVDELLARVQEQNTWSRRVLENAGLKNHTLDDPQRRRVGSYMDYATELKQRKDAPREIG